LRGLDLNQRPSGYESETGIRSSPTLEGKTADSETVEQPLLGAQGSSPEPTVTLSHDFVGQELADARSAWDRDADPKALRRALLELLRRLEENE